MLVNGTHVRRLDLDGKAAAEPPFAAEMRDHTFLQPHTTPQNVGGPHLFEGQSASGTATFAAAFAFAFVVGRMACRLTRWRRLTGDDAPELAAAPTTSLGAVVSQAEVGVQPPAAAVWTEEVDVL